MKRIDVLELDDGTHIGIEVDLPPGSDNKILVSANRDRETIAFSKALDRVTPIAARLLQSLKSIAESPDQVDVTFGLKLSADLGVIVASGSTEANFSVKLTWKSPQNAGGS